MRFSFHGCPKCKKNRDLKPYNNRSGKTMEDLYQDTLVRAEAIKAAGYKLVELWGCELDQQLMRNPDMRLFFDSTVLMAPMIPRLAFFGGRTNATKLLHVFLAGEKGMAADVCSLYPTTLMYDEFPVGHPVIITENFQRITKAVKPYKGLIYCSVIPPRGLLHPVLPYRALDKTCFPLCRTCVVDRQKRKCRHSDGERELTGVWTHVELNKAVDLGYFVSFADFPTLRLVQIHLF